MNNDRVDSIAYLVMCVAILVITFGGSYLINRFKCGSQAKVMGMSYKYGPFMGCMVKTNTGYRPIESLRNID